MLSKDDLAFLAQGIKFDEWLIGADTAGEIFLKTLDAMVAEGELDNIETYLADNVSREELKNEWFLREVVTARDMGIGHDMSIDNVLTTSQVLMDRLALIDETRDRLNFIKEQIHYEVDAAQKMHDKALRKWNDLLTMESVIQAKLQNQELLDGVAVANMAECDECGISFVKNHPNQKYCGYQCSKKAANRRHREKTKEGQI
jgi:ribosomal protein L16 Arg81 hydroxylase